MHTWRLPPSNWQDLEHYLSPHFPQEGKSLPVFLQVEQYTFCLQNFELLSSSLRVGWRSDSSWWDDLIDEDEEVGEGGVRVIWSTFDALFRWDDVGVRILYEDDVRLRWEDWLVQELGEPTETNSRKEVFAERNRINDPPTHPKWPTRTTELTHPTYMNNPAHPRPPPTHIHIHDYPSPLFSILLFPFSLYSPSLIYFILIFTLRYFYLLTYSTYLRTPYLLVYSTPASIESSLSHHHCQAPSAHTYIWISSIYMFVTISQIWSSTIEIKSEKTIPRLRTFQVPGW